MSDRSNAWRTNAAVALDVRPELAAGGDPLVSILSAAAHIQPGQSLVIVAPFEPVPLYGVLAARGFDHETECVAAGEWVVCFSRG